MSEIKIQSLGPIERLTIPIPPLGGVVVLRGRNGAGKSQALEGVAALYDPGARRELRPTDGSPSGSIEGLGVVVRLGRANRASGELEVAALDGNIDPSKIVDPGIKDPEAADRKRLETLVRLSGISIDGDAWKAYAQKNGVEPEAMPDLLEDPVADANRVRLAIHDAALRHERLAKSLREEAIASETSIRGVDLDAPCDQADLQAELANAIGRISALEADERRYHEARLVLASARPKLAELEATTADPRHVEAELRAASSHATKAAEVVTDLRRQLEAAVRDADQADSEVRSASARLDLARKAAATRDVLREQLAAAEARRCPTTETIAEARRLRDEAYGKVERGEVVRRARATNSRAQQQVEEARTHEAAAARLRDAARGTDAMLEQALSGAGYGSIRVVGGRLCLQTARGSEPISELSRGERWAFALGLAASGLPRGAILPVCQEAWEGLDPAHRTQIAEMARKLGLVLVTAEAAEGELRAEVLG